LHRDHSNTREHILDAVVELGDQPVLALLSLFAPGNVKGQTFEAHKATFSVELGF
jgi:hypothetical protein